MYSELDYVKSVLRALGERPVNSLDTPHPRVASARAALAEASLTVQSTTGGWWFNVEHPTLEPQLDGRVALPNDTLTIDGITPYPHVAQRGRFLYNMQDSTNVFTEAVKVRITRLIAFDDLPIEAKLHVSAVAKETVLAGLDADGSKRETAQREVSRTYSNLHAQHIRSYQGSMLETPSMAQHMHNIRGYPGIATLGDRRYG